MLRVYVDHYNHQRPHRSLDLQPPNHEWSPPRSTVGEIRRRDRLGSLIHEYYRAAELDGSIVNVPVNAKTRVLVDGKTALLRDVEPGFLAIAKCKAGKPTQELQALSPQGAAGVTVVQSVLADAVVVTAADGTTVTIRVNAKTRVFVDGKPAQLQSGVVYVIK